MKKHNEYIISHKFMNRDTGELLDEREAQTQWREEYDGDDPTNCIKFKEQYLQIC